MQYKLSILSLVSAVILLGGCGENSSSNKFDTTIISGKTTLVRAMVCLDENQNQTCDESEVSTITDDEGTYYLEVNNRVEEGSTLLATDGYNTILLQNNRHRLLFNASYSKDEQRTNINTLSTLVHTKIEEGMSYTEAKKYIADKYLLDIDIVLSDPVESVDKDSRLLQISYAAESKASGNVSTSKQRFFFNFFKKEEKPEEEVVVVTETEVDESVSDGSYLDFNVDTYLEQLNTYVESVSSYFDTVYNEIFGEEEAVATDVTREALNGVWFLKNSDTPDSLCAEIDALDNITVYTNDSTDELAIEYDGVNTIDLVYGWSTVETFVISNFTNIAFDVEYSDGTASISKVATLAECKTKL